MDPLFTPPPTYSLPLSKGGDLIVDFKNKVPGSDPAEYQDYPAGVALVLEIDAETPIQAEAAISGYHAVARVESEVADTVARGVLWRCIYQAAGTPVSDIIVTNGTVARYDGKPQ